MKNNQLSQIGSEEYLFERIEEISKELTKRLSLILSYKDILKSIGDENLTNQGFTISKIKTDSHAIQIKRRENQNGRNTVAF